MPDSIEPDTWYIHEEFGRVYVSELLKDMDRTQVLYDDQGCFRIEYLETFTKRVVSVDASKVSDSSDDEPKT